jgi:hypothetical protein
VSVVKRIGDDAPESSVFYRRLFLNPPGWHSNAFILAHVEQKDQYPTLRISDCDRIISISLDGDDDTARANNLEKLDRIYETIRDFRKSVRAEWAKLAEEQRKKRK